MAVYTTEITSDSLDSDNPIHQRLFKAYHLALPYIKGDLLEIGCGEGRGIDLLLSSCERYVAIDKIGQIIEKLRPRYPKVEFIQMNIPPMTEIQDNSFDRIISFQVIEHIKNDHAFLEEIHRILKPGGTALLTTPNRKFSLTRNPWHEREYLGSELSDLCKKVFNTVEIKGIMGNEKVMSYYNQNKKSVEKITRFDPLNLQYRLPKSWLRVPYEILNRLNRQSLKKQDNSLVASITHEDYLLTDDANEGLDLLCVLTKD